MRYLFRSHLEQFGVGRHGLFFQVADEAVNIARTDQIRDGEERHHHSLGAHHARAEHCARVLETQRRHQMHAFVLSLLCKQAVARIHKTIMNDFKLACTTNVLLSLK